MSNAHHYVTELQRIDAKLDEFGVPPGDRLLRVNEALVTRRDALAEVERLRTIESAARQYVHWSNVWYSEMDSRCPEGVETAAERRAEAMDTLTQALEGTPDGTEARI